MNPIMASDWTSTASLEMLQRRAQLLMEIRLFFANRKVLEVQTPLLSASTNPDPNLVSFTTLQFAPGNEKIRTLYLQTSPEFHMKRLLAEGSGPIYQIAHAFRNEESGRYHNPEFHLLEWYRPNFTYIDLMDEVDELLQTVGSFPKALRSSYQDLFMQSVSICPFSAETASLFELLKQYDIHINTELSDRDEILQLILTHIIEPQLPQQPIFIYDYPRSQGMLAALDPKDPRIAQRFELYINKLEIGNGFQELQDPLEQQARFQNHRQCRQQKHLADIPLDEHFLSALKHGLPFCSGVAIGIDRLLLCIENQKALENVIAFPIERA